MSCRKCFHISFSNLIHTIILLAFLLQVYAQYSTIFFETSIKNNVTTKSY